jgi:hypothetical protein
MLYEDVWIYRVVRGIIIPKNLFKKSDCKLLAWHMQLLSPLLLALCAATPAAFAIPRSLLDPFGPPDHKIYYQVRTV